MNRKKKKVEIKDESNDSNELSDIDKIHIEECGTAFFYEDMQLGYIEGE